MEMQAPNIFEYNNYRSFLNDYIQYRKRKNPNFGIRYFSKRSGFRSPATLSMVLLGKRRLGIASVENVSKAIALKGLKKIYFEKLVRYECTKDNKSKLDIQNDLSKIRSRKVEVSLGLKQYDILSRWYISAIYELIATKGFVHNPEWIAKRLKNEVSATDVENAIAQLISLELLVSRKGKLERAENALSTTEDIPQGPIQKYHREMLAKAEESLVLPVLERDLSGITLAVKKSELPLIKEKIRQFRTELNESLSQVTDADSVYQFNIQFFPLTNESEK